MKPIPVYYSFARSGGTLVNQLIGSHPQCLVLSEINPAASYKSVVEQAVEWLHLVDTDEATAISKLPYSELLLELHSRASLLGKTLVVRDWVTVNFLPDCAEKTVIPSGILEQKLFLNHSKLEIAPFVVARRSIDIYDSIRQNFPHLKTLDLGIFSQAYLKYAKAVCAYPVVQLESLRSEPRPAVDQIFSLLGFDQQNYDHIFGNFSSFQHCTGNNTLTKPCLTSNMAEILALNSPKSSEVTLIKQHPSLAAADRLLGYE